jgi:3-polyprenyl-4-hydroxybenzoate decarboxylase
MSYKDVREWIQKVDEMGELKIVEHADWNLEIGALSVLSSKHKENTPALLFGRYVVVVDDDIDVYDINDILWAICSRSRADPVDATEIIRRCWSGPLDPIIPKEKIGRVSASMHAGLSNGWQTSRPPPKSTRSIRRV